MLVDKIVDVKQEVEKMKFPTADESSANKIQHWLEQFAAKGYRKFDVGTSADHLRPEQVDERRAWDVSNRHNLAAVAREMVRYLHHFPTERHRTFTAIS
jgi:hypothetical protein